MGSAREVLEENNTDNWRTWDILAENVAVFCPSVNLPEARFKSNRLLSLAEEASRQPYK